MGFCVDRSTRILKDQGYNVVRHPAEGLAPLDIFGIIGGQTILVGDIASLVEEPSEARPEVETGLNASSIEGQKTSKLPLSIGLDILGAALGGLGGKVGVTAAFEAARKLQFSYENVTRSRAFPDEIGKYLDSGEVRWDAMGIREFFGPRNRLFVVTETVQASKIGVTAWKSRSGKLEVSIPAIEELLGDASISIGNEDDDASAEATKSVSFEGVTALVFGFQCLEIAVMEDPDDDENLRLTFKPAKAGTVPLGAERDESRPVILSDDGLLGDLPKRVD